ncbi:hypothetical protein GCM10011342_29550 [Aquisalinus flavus]|uniref:Uncharacterized protein n=1 Tax=Aquisalinus flavus TaxID=1526572 RepID=A0A8J2V643_9PROT|nr:hypothetical protein [Aquisalinus flavus]MBD0428065.1 hypothetical protein [Aquisalinus flavus]GGD18923.1 hypothetical protein GCM10011342_29550 [Aquisalinus flavus]
MFTMFPLLFISLIVYVILHYLVGDGWSASQLMQIPMVSGDMWRITYGDAFIIISMGLLFVELLRSTKTGSDSILNHALSVVVFIISLLAFIIMPGFGNSVFFIFLSMTFLDFMAGFIVTTVTARRDFGISGGFGN